MTRITFPWAPENVIHIQPMWCHGIWQTSLLYFLFMYDPKWSIHFLHGLFPHIIFSVKERVRISNGFYFTSQSSIIQCALSCLVCVIDLSWHILRHLTIVSLHDPMLERLRGFQLCCLINLPSLYLEDIPSATPRHPSSTCVEMYAIWTVYTLMQIYSTSCLQWGPTM